LFLDEPREDQDTLAARRPFAQVRPYNAYLANDVVPSGQLMHVTDSVLRSYCVRAAFRLCACCVVGVLARLRRGVRGDGRAALGSGTR
jgi:hypothetical protein